METAQIIMMQPGLTRRAPELEMLAWLASLRSKVWNEIGTVTQGRPAVNRANPGLSDETPLGFTDGKKKRPRSLKSSGLPHFNEAS